MQPVNLSKLVNRLKRAALIASALSVALTTLALSGQTRRIGRKTRPTQTTPLTTATPPPAPQGEMRPAILLESLKAEAIVKVCHWLSRKGARDVTHGVDLDLYSFVPGWRSRADRTAGLH